jgi:hypothetical protein
MMLMQGVQTSRPPEIYTIDIGTRAAAILVPGGLGAALSGEPYHPVLEALAELCRADEAVPALLRAVAPTWLLQLPWLSTVEQREALVRAGLNFGRMLREMGNS